MKPLPGIPAAVREEAGRIAAEDSELGQIAHLLVTDPRMVGVWRYLKSLKIAHPDLWETPPADMAVAAMVLVLHNCCLSRNNVIDTVAELHKTRDSFKHQAKRLRREANRLHRREYSGKDDDEVEEQVAALTRVAEWCEEQATRFHEAAIVRDGGVIQRKSKRKHWREEMGLAEAIAGTMKLLYGSPQYGTTATIVNVITETQPDKKGNVVLATHVRDWLKAIGSEGNSAERRRKYSDASR